MWAALTCFHSDLSNVLQKCLSQSGSVSSEDSDPEPPPVITRKVSFADAFGLDLVSVKEFDSWNTPKKWADNLLDDDRGEDSAEYFLLCLFTVPSTAEELMEKLADQKIELEHVELLPETVALRGIIRVMNLCFEKRVYVRSTLDGWDTHMDLLADFIPGSSDGETDRFSFTLRLVPPCKEERSRVEFCLRYETVFGTFWANNGGVNYRGCGGAAGLACACSLVGLGFESSLGCPVMDWCPILGVSPPPPAVCPAFMGWL
uniref:CBM21 domain-containing protein n=1 Tax=Scleropages formosus TaxID=113540 RepID=A0A8C9UZE3_SCLFO